MRRQIYLRTASADTPVSAHLLRRLVFYKNPDILLDIPARNQDLTFNGTLDLLRQNNVHATNSKQFFKSFAFFTNDGKFNRLAQLLSDQNDSPIAITRFAVTTKDVMGNRLDFGNESLLLIVNEVLGYFKMIFRNKKVDLSTGIRKEASLFDLDAVREAWVNACAHNAWNELIPPAIHVYDDRFEFISHGGIPYGLSPKEFYSGMSHPVNPRLFDVFTACNFSEKTGYGVPKIIPFTGRRPFL